ncbi:GPI alpha-1,6-mannosyltransferase 2 isoform X2 [Podarcis muralis]
MTSKVRMLQRKEGDPHCQEVVRFAVLCRVLTLFLQVLTRFLGSSSPVLYWFCAHLLHDYEPLLQNGSQSSQHGTPRSDKPSLANSLPNWNRNENPVLTLLCNWRQTTTLTKCILGYVLSYWMLGLVLHCNFFPWT